MVDTTMAVETNRDKTWNMFNTVIKVIVLL